MADELVHRNVDCGIATITLDSPRNRNALSQRLVGELLDHLAAAAEDDAARAVVLTHTGPTFCAGADLTEMTARGTEQATRAMLGVFAAIVELPKPVITRLAGGARAGGIGLVGASDIAIAAPAATFAFSEARLGLAPAMISLVTWTRMDERAASRYYLTGDVFDASEAARIGLLTEATSDLDGRTSAYLDSLRKCSPQGLAESKAIAAAHIRQTIKERGEEMARLSGRLFASEEANEGMRAFLERRPPRWAR